MQMKQEILRVAEQLLKEHGYDKATYQMIADVLGISKSVITYHFKSKPLLVSRIFENYIYEIDAYIKANLTDGYNCYLYHCIVHICLYREVLKNERNKAIFFHKELFDLWFNEKISSIEDYLREIANESNKDFTEEDIHINAVINQGAKKSIFEEYLRNPGSISTYKLCYHYVYLLGMLSMLDESAILKNIIRAFDFVDSHTYPQIYLLT